MTRSRRVLLARAIAIAADVVQLGALPLFGAGLVSPLDELLDLAIGAALVAFVGWHVAFLPTFLAELVPLVDIFPTWTAAVFFVTRHKSGGVDGGRPRAADSTQ
jgi:hypothetical protein